LDAEWQEFTSAIAAGDDARSETAALRLHPAHQGELLALMEAGGEQRWWAVRTLAAVGDATAMPAVAAALDDADNMTRAAAALALGHLASRFPDESAPFLPALGARFADDDGFVRQQAVEGMALAGPTALPLLESLITPTNGDPPNDEVVRVRAAATLRLMRDKRCAGLLFRLLNDSNHLVHTYAYEALEDLGLLDNLLLAR